MYASRTPPESPPCEACRVELAVENEETAAVYMATRRQYITAGQNNVPVDISIPAIKIVMDLRGVKDQESCLSRVQRVWHHFNNERGEE